MNRHLTLLITVLCFASQYTTAQENNPLINSAEAIQAGIKLYDEGKYKEALKEYQKVKIGDTNYVWTLYEMALTCSSDSQFTKGVQICEEALSLTTERERCPELLMQYGSLLDYDNRQERALKIYDSALAIYPAYTGLYISKGTTLIRMKKWKEAEQVFKQALLINPYSASAHFKLGICALNQGNVVPAYLSLLANIIMEPQGRFSNNVITLLSNMANGKDDVVELVNKRKEEPSENYRSVEQIVLSKIALDANYKSLIELNDPISKQLQVICEKLSYDENDKDFWMQFYVPFYRQMFEEKKFDCLVYYSFSGVNLPVIKEFNRKKKKDIEAFVNETSEYFRLIRATRELQPAKRNYNGACYYFSGGQLLGKGVSRNNGEVFTGPWEFYYASGNKKATGTYNEKGDREGTWKYYYFTGQLKAEEEYRNGKLDGKQAYYHENGVLSARSIYKDGQADGEHIAYYKNGAVKFIEQLSNGKLNGNRKEFSGAGVLQSVAMFVDDKKNGAFKTYYNNGQLESEGTYTDNKLNGPYKAYYDDGAVATVARYDQDKPVGEIKKFYANGKPQSVEIYNNGILEGEYVSYYDNGQLYTKYINKKGKVDGDVQYFDKDGKMFSTLTFDNDKVKVARYFDKTGKQISSSELTKGRLDLTSYLPDGTKKAFSPYNAKGNLEGTQTYYYGSGKEKESNTYTNGELNGEAATWYCNGQKNATIPYVTGKKDGYYTSHYIHGGKNEEGWYKDDQLQGDWLTYDEAGNLTARSGYLNGELNGLRTEYWPNGKKESDMLYDMGVLLQMTQYDTTGKVINKVRLKNGTGKLTSLYVNGKLNSVGNYLNGSLDGPYKHFYFDGSAQAEQYFKKGVRDSIFKTFYYGGKISQAGMYKMGDRTGTWKFYHEDGTLSRVEEYRSGKLNGKRIYYFSNGKPESEVTYENGERRGLYKKYTEDGMLVYQMNFDDDLPVGYSYLGKNNELVPEIPMPRGCGKFKPLFPNGKVAIEATYIDGSQHGTYKYYHPNGKLLLENTENYGNSEGILKEYYADGTQRSIFNYLHDNIHGNYKQFNAKGILVEEGNDYNGDYHGEVRYFDDNGKLKSVRTYYYGQLLSVK
jgi:antitoxin component YwqK of YwqJK toxin-antitoxin module/Tfp pilus assembly protein PilF